jgi:hypothetical protein
MKALSSLLVPAFLTAALASAQVTVPDGTKIRVRLDQAVSSASADEGQVVEFSVTDAVKVGDQVVIPEGARVTGTVTDAQEKRRMGRAGKLDFSIDRVRAADGEWIPLRYTLNKKSGQSNATKTGIITAGVAVVFWPAAPVVLLMKGKDVTVNKGVVFDTFTDQDHVLASAGAPAAGNAITAGVKSQPNGSASVTITSDVPGADIEVDGGYVGSTPTTLMLPAGPHQVAVHKGASQWQRSLQVTANSQVTVNATVEEAKVALRKR